MAPTRRLRDRLNDYLPRKKPKPAPAPAPAPTLSNPDLIDGQLEMEYATLEAREASFLPPTKRAKGWPHKSPSPQDLAKAGFFWKPTSSKDNVECFMCGRHLDGWEEEDDALQEHLKHGPDCVWAVLMSVDAEGAYDTDKMDDPTGPQLTEARRTTFETIGWPHEAKRGWTCKTEKLVEAGWHFAPTTECEDYTSCVYCKLSLDGWEPKDNPFEEHYKRSPACPFFVFAGTTAPSKRPKKSGGRASRTSKTSRMSTQSNTTLMSQADESTGIIEILGEDTTLENVMDNSVVSIQSTTSTTTKGKRKAPARAKGAVTKKAKTTKSKKTELEPDSQLEDQSVTIEEQPPPKKSRTKKKQPEPEPEITEAMDAVEEKPHPPLKKSRTKKKQPTPEPEPEPELALDNEIESDTVEEQPKRRSSGRTKKEVTPEPQSEMEQQMEEAVVEEQPRRRSSRRMTREPTPEEEQEREQEEMEVDQAQPQEEESAAYPSLPGEFPEETPDNFEDAEEEQAHAESTPQPETQTMGPPENEGTPIPAKQISPLKEQTNPPRPSITQAQFEEQQNKRRSSRLSGTKHKQKEIDRSPSQPSDEENRPPSSLPKEKRPPLSSSGAPPPTWTPVDVDTILQGDAEIDLFGGVVNGTLSEKEKDMTVQEWIGHIAEQAESSLSAEGERIVTIFEREGRRALAALEGIQCV